MALSEYMPYGAPELLEGAHSRMARSTLLASLTVATLFCLGGTLLARGVPALTPEIDTSIFTISSPPMEPEVRIATPEIVPARARVDPGALPVPAPDIAVPIADSPVPWSDDTAAGPAGNEATRGPGPVGVVVPREKDPEPGDHVYVDVFPNLVTSPAPHYPELAREAGVEGVVRVLMLVGLDGRVERAQIAPGGSVPLLDVDALAAARACVFTPALTSGHAVKVWVSRSYRFSLH